MVVCVANVLISILSTCLYLRFLWALNDFPALATQMGALMQVIVSAALVCLLDAAGLTSARQPITVWRWLELGCWFSLMNTLEIAAVDVLGSSNGSLTCLLQQAVIPLTLFLSTLLLNRRYAILHWLAASVVIGGIAATYAPMSGDTHVPLGWAMLYVGSRVPQSLANVRSEQLLTAAPPPPDAAARDGRDVTEDITGVDVTALAPSAKRTADELRDSAMAGMWTAAVCLVLNVPSSLLLGYARGRPAAELLTDYTLGVACLLGHNVTTDDGRYSRSQCDGTAAGAAAAFALPGALFALSEFQVLQAAGASTYFLLVALELPIQTAVLAAPWAMGSFASSSHPSLHYGVPLVMFGIALWGLAERRQGSQHVSGCDTARTATTHPSLDALASAHERPASMLSQGLLVRGVATMKPEEIGEFHRQHASVQAQ